MEDGVKMAEQLANFTFLTHKKVIFRAEEHNAFVPDVVRFIPLASRLSHICIRKTEECAKEPKLRRRSKT